MTTKLSGEKPTEKTRDQQKAEAIARLEGLVRDNVLSGLGKPAGLHRVQVKCVWGDFYRVNVYRGLDIASFTVAHSYFLEADGNGQILTSAPAITRMY